MCLCMCLYLSVPAPAPAFPFLVYLSTSTSFSVPPHDFRSHSMAAVYHDYKDEDMFLYITYSGENVFGADEDVASADASAPAADAV